MSQDKITVAKPCAYAPCGRPHYRRSRYCSDLCRKVDQPPKVQAAPERELQVATEQLLRELQRLGRIVAWYHAPARPGASRKPHQEQRGFPDLAVKIRPLDRPVLIELKQQGHQPRPEQRAWLTGEGAVCCWALGEVHAALTRWGVDLSEWRE